MFGSVFDDDNLISEMPISWLIDRNPMVTKGNARKRLTSLQYVVNHVFFNPNHSKFHDNPAKNDPVLVRAVCVAARAYHEYVDRTDKPQWVGITDMLDNFEATIEHWNLSSELVLSQLRAMKPRDILVFCIRSQNFGIIFRKQASCMVYEPIDIIRHFPLNYEDKLPYSHPELVIEIPNDVFDNSEFQSSLADFLSRMSDANSNGKWHEEKSWHTDDAVGFIWDSRQDETIYHDSLLYSPELFTGILRSVGHPAEPVCVTKCLSHEVGTSWRGFGRIESAEWSRSLPWPFIKVAIQSSLNRSPSGRATYKQFMLFFMCNLANHGVSVVLSNDLLHLMSTKILRRLRKLGSSSPGWLSDTVHHVCDRLSETMDKRPIGMQAVQCFSPSFAPFRLDLTRDTWFAVPWIREYIPPFRTIHSIDPPHVTFLPGPYLQGTLDDFLSSQGNLFEQAYRYDPHMTLRSVDRAVDLGIDDWTTSVQNTDEACLKLKILANQYLSGAYAIPRRSRSRRWLDSDEDRDRKYFPEGLSAVLLTMLKLWVAIDKLVIKEIPLLTYYSPEVSLSLVDRVLVLNPMGLSSVRRLYHYISSRHNQSRQGWSVFSSELTPHSFPILYFDSYLHHLRNHIEKDALSSNPLHARIVLFKQHCPTYFQLWCDVTNFLFHPSDKISEPGDGPTIPAHLSLNHGLTFSSSHHRIRDLLRSSDNFVYGLPSGLYMDSQLQPYLANTTHTSNEILSTRKNDQHSGLSQVEFIAFAHLRSGGSLQWVNILRELRDRKLNFRHPEVYLLLVQASAQLGPLSSTGDLLWHQELQDISFCYALLDELESLCDDLNSGLSDGPGIATITLLARSVSVNRHTDIVNRVIQLLREVRRKTFGWVQQQLYDLTISPINKEGRQLLVDMAEVCRSTFDMEHDIIHKLLCSAEDVEVVLSCAFLIRTFPVDPSKISTYSRLLLEQDLCLSLALESVLKDVVRADPSNHGIDLAIRNIMPGYRPNSGRWVPYQDDPNSHWLVCETGNHRGQITHVDILNGVLLLDGKPIRDTLPSEIIHHPEYRRIFGDKNFVVSPSDILGMDFVTRFMISNYYVHFSLRGNDLAIRTQDKYGFVDLIPHGKIEGDLPSMLVEGHAHWLHLSTSIIEIRPLGRVLEQSHENWKIVPDNDCYRITKGHESLVNIHSTAWAMASRPVKCLEIPENLIITVSPIHTIGSLLFPRVTVILPRYGLSFFINENHELESCDFKDMVCSESQCIGTLVDLVNRLILRPKSEAEKDLTTKRILIPNGEVRVEKDDCQVRVVIDTLGKTVTSYDEFGFATLEYRSSPRQPVMYHTYTVDPELGRLTGIVSLSSRLYLARLHALTSSSCRPDPLTGRTGLEEAISLVYSAGTRLLPSGSESTNDGNIRALKGMRSPQLRFASTLLGLHDVAVIVVHGDDDDEPEVSLHAMRHEAYLFPSETIECPPRNSDKVSTHNQTLMRETQRKSRLGNTQEFGYAIAAAVYQSSLKAEELRAVIAQLNVFTPSSGPEQEVDPWLARHRWTKKHIDKHLDAGSEAPSQRFQLLFFLPSLLSSTEWGYHSAGVILLSTLIAFAKQLNINHPEWIRLVLSDGYHPDLQVLRKFLAEAWCGTDRNSKSSDVDHLSGRLVRFWPSKKVPAESLWQERTDPFDMARLTSNLQPFYSRWYHNYIKLNDYLMNIVYKLRPKSQPLTPSISLDWYTPVLSPEWQTTLGRLLSERAAPQLPTSKKLPFYHPPRRISSSDTTPLGRLLSSLRENDTSASIQNQYVFHLQESEHRFHMEGETAMAFSEGEKPSLSALEQHYKQCRVYYTEGFDIIKDTLGPRTDFERILYQSGQWPRVTPWTVFRCLAFTSPIKLSDKWRICLISLAHLALELQRAQRLVQLSLNKLEEELFMELQNDVDDRVATECLDWLLMQLQGNFLIRRVQVDAAREMMSPRSGSNTVMQINMGEGKSSVIIPMCVAALANGDQLVRVILPEALKTQQLQILSDRLGGLLCKPIFHFTFTRHSEKDGQINRLRKLMSECRDECGVIVMQPEHALSLKLSCVETQLLDNGSVGADATPVLRKSENSDHHLRTSSLAKLLHGGSYVSALIRGAKKWLQKLPPETTTDLPVKVTITKAQLEERDEGISLQTFIQDHIRDILDESDEILQPRLQLIYTIGHQLRVDGLPDRWVITQKVLWLAGKHASSFDPAQDEVKFELGHSGLFPYIRILQPIGGTKLISKIVEDVLEGGISTLIFPLWLRGAIRAFISHKDVSLEAAKMVEDYAKQGTSWNALLILRGLFANGILLFSLVERRWRVDYGLDPSRTLVAIPYQAKDVPAKTAEFGHPDTTIVLTCLSYYYGGLTDEQLKQSFEILQEQDDPSNEYRHWVSSCSERLPKSLQNLSSFDIESVELWNRYIFPSFSRNQRAIDFYLSRVVFPMYAKDFPWKISGSSWDIAERKNYLTTGFSGTNDAQYLLPVSINQDDPEHLRQTRSNAMVLTYLLQPENGSYLVTSTKHDRRMNTLKLLEAVVAEKPEIRVLLDIGAQILDLSNCQLAQAWLEISPGTAGVIYFGEDGELMVLARNGRSQPLSASPLSQQLDRCVAYLDHAHTRGTDIRFPRGFRAGVILGPKITKDRLVQGCMRMRKLGHGHSVKFFAPPQVDHAIRSVARKGSTEVITTADILHWTIRETWSDIRGRAPYWAQQGMQHKSQHQAWIDFCHNELEVKQLTDSWLQPEHRSLVQLFAPGHSTVLNLPMVLDGEIRRRCDFLGVSSLPNARLEEDQERVVVREIERQREVPRPPETSPARHSLHPDVKNFVRNGTILLTSTAFRPVFTTLNNTTAATDEAHMWSPYILATADFCRTVENNSDHTEESGDDYLRPVQWVLSGKMHENDILVILSPFEAEHLMPDIRLSEHVHLHAYIPRTSKAMKPCDDLRLYSIPPVPSTWTPPWALIDQLNVFAGQLYFRDFESYVRLSRFLGVHREDLPSDTTTLTKPNWLNMPGSLHQGIEEMFEGNPLGFVMVLLALRSRGMRFDDTHMGRLLQGWLLNRDDFPSFESSTRMV